ncbi:MAG: transposase, partial [Deltaproteobacteria bacterium]|nr:transposase [Deltaproteobacteria bacterium]
PRVGAVRRAATDAVWRAALRLPWSFGPPDEKTLREFEAFLRAPHASVNRPRFELAFEHWTRLFLERGGLVADPVWMIDSTPMWCFGAVLDTIRLLGDGLRSLGRRWARARKTDLATVALEWGEPLLLAQSTKGHFEGTDWADQDARSDVLAKLATTVTRATEFVLAGLDSVRENKRKPLARLARNLVRVVSEDLEADKNGAMQVVERTTSARLISYTDPDAQHFRKSKSKVCSGFKLHALGDAVSGLVLSLSVTPGGAHDSTQLHPLVARARALCRDLRELLADAAYGGVGVRTATRDQHGVTVLAPPVANARKGDGLGKEDFAIDFAVMRATCPGGVATSAWKMTKEGDAETPMFTWSKESSAECTCADKCPVHRDRRRHLKLHPLERELREIRAEWEKSEVRKRYRRRTEGERLMREMTRRGARRAGAWGLDNASLQAHCAGGVHNLRLLARLLAANPEAASTAA